MLLVSSNGPETVRTRWISGLETRSPYILGLARIIAGLQILERGVITFTHFPAPDPHFGEPLSLLLMNGGIIEVVGGTLIAVGLFTRTAAFICSGEMAVAFLLFQERQRFWFAPNQGDAAILFCIFFLYLVFAGPGRFNLQSVMSRWSREPSAPISHRVAVCNKQEQQRA